MSEGIKITGNWDFDNKKNVEKTDYKSDGLTVNNKKLIDNVNLKDGIDAKEAENIMMAFEDDGLVDFDDFDINDKDIKQFLSNRGIKDATDKQIESMKSVVNAIASTYQEENKTSGTKENYKEVTDIYLVTSTEDISITPNKFKDGQVHSITPSDKKDGVTLDDFINEAYDFNKILGESANKIDLDGIKHNLVDEYIQSNPELADRIVNLYNEGKSANNQVKSIKDLTYDQITSLNLYSDDITSKEPFEVIAPKFDTPMPKGSKFIVDTEVVQTQYSTEKPNTSVTIMSDSKADLKSGLNQYASVEDAIADKYGLDKKDKNYQNALNTIAFQVANDPKNQKLIEEYINQINPTEDFATLDDNSRVEALLALEDAKGLKLPDNVLENDLKFSSGNYTYKQGTETYQLSLRSSAEGKELQDFKLPETADKTDIHNLEDILKYSYDPRTGEVLKGLDEDGNEVLNIKDQASQGMADAYMLNSIKDNTDIYAAMQEIDGQLELFGCYEIDEKALKLDKPISEMLADAKDDGMSLEDAANKVRKELLKKTNGSVDDFLEKYGKVDLDKAKDIELYDSDGNVRFKDANGNPVTYKVSETYVRFGTAGAKSTNKKTTNTGTPLNTGVPSNTGTGVPSNTGTGTPTSTPTGTGVPTGTPTGTTPTGTTPTGTTPTGTTPTGTTPTGTTPTGTGEPTGPSETPTGTGTPTSNPDIPEPTGSNTDTPTPPTSTGTETPSTGTGTAGSTDTGNTCGTGAAGSSPGENPAPTVSTGNPNPPSSDTPTVSTGNPNPPSDENPNPPSSDKPAAGGPAEGGNPGAGVANPGAGVDAGISAGEGKVEDSTANVSISTPPETKEVKAEVKIELKAEVKKEKEPEEKQEE